MSISTTSSSQHPFGILPNLSPYPSPQPTLCLQNHSAPNRHPLRDGSKLPSLIGADSDSPLFEIHSLIYQHPTPTTSAINLDHHSDALHTLPLIKRMHSTADLNVTLTRIPVPHSYPRLQLFIVAFQHIAPYAPVQSASELLLSKPHSQLQQPADLQPVHTFHPFKIFHNYTFPIVIRMEMGVIQASPNLD